MLISKVYRVARRRPLSARWVVPLTTCHDAQVTCNNAFTAEGMKLSLGVNNVFAKDPPICLTCSLNGYDAGTYDIPGRFWYISMDYKF